MLERYAGSTPGLACLKHVEDLLHAAPALSAHLHVMCHLSSFRVQSVPDEIIVQLVNERISYDNAFSAQVFP